MTWQAYHLIYKLQSNMLIGWHTLGYINLTRYYIPGKNMWASFTDNLTRSEKEEAGLDGYIKHGNQLKDNVLLSYFYPASNADKPMMPRYTDEGLWYGDLPIEQFEKQYISSVGKTAILPHINAKEDGSLHEMEFIKPLLSFVGYVFIAKTASGLALDTAKFNNVFKEIFVGGERKYGWGRLTLSGAPLPVSDNLFFGHTLCLDKEKPQIVLKNDAKYLPAHTEVLPENKILCKGNIENLAGRETLPSKGNRGAGPGRKITGAKLCWMPGSQLTGDDEIKFRLGAYGLMEEC